MDIPTERKPGLAPKPYKLCQQHFAMNCTLCPEDEQQDMSAMLESTPVAQPMAPIPPAAPAPPPEPPQPEFTDPVAVQVMEAGKRFAAARETLMMIEGQLMHAVDVMEMLKQKQAQARIELADAQNALTKIF